MTVPNQFANVTTSIPLSQLDANFNTPITLGNTAIQLGNTVTTLNNMTLANVTVSSGNVTITNVSVTTANVTTANIATLSVTGNANVDGDTTLGNASTDTVTVNGYMGVGGAGVSQNALNIISTGLTGSSACRGVNVAPTFQSGATTSGSGVVSAPSTAAASFTMTNMYSFAASNGTKGAGSTITNQYGFQCDDLTRGDNIFGFSSAISSGANKWNIYASGTADNYFAGNVGVGVTPSASTIAQFEGGSNLLLVGRGNAYFSNNATFNSAFKYINSAAAGQYQIGGSTHRWYTAASGTAGNAITFTQAMTLSATGSLGLGITSPTNWGSYQGLEINGTSGGILSLLVNTTERGRLQTFSTEFDIYAVGAIPMVFNTNGTERARITSDGYLRMASGSLGIQFNGDTAAANALDDYEEGTFTPTIVGTTTAGTATYSVQVGRYTKVGNRVLFEARVTYTGGTGTGNLRLAGLPFTSNANCQSSLAANYGNLVLTASNIAQCYVIGSSTSIAIEQYPTGGGAATSVAYDAAATILVAGHYEV